MPTPKRKVVPITQGSSGGSQLAAVEAFVGTLESEQRDEPLIAMATGLALAVDAEPGNAALWRELRVAVQGLREAAERGTDDDAAFRDELRTQVGNTKKS